MNNIEKQSELIKNTYLITVKLPPCKKGPPIVEAQKFKHSYELTEKEKAINRQGYDVELVVYYKTSGVYMSVSMLWCGMELTGGSPYIIPMFDVVREEEHREYTEYSSKTEFNNI